MRIAFLRSRRCEADANPDDAYVQTFDTRYAERVIGNLTGDEDFCRACGPDCIGCREPYHRRFAGHIVADVSFPSVLPYVIENPQRHVPDNMPPHDVLIAIAIHGQVLLECVKAAPKWGTRGIVVPIEAPDWVRGGTIREAERICTHNGVEIAFPKPFCNFKPPEGGVLATFRRAFHVGFPEVTFTVSQGRIEKAHVDVSAPCGCTYFIARGLEGRRLDEDLKFEIISKRLHSYPCTASMAWDDEIGDTILHVAGDNHYRLLEQLGAQAEADRAGTTRLSPHGVPLPEIVPPAENLQKIEDAQAAVLSALDEREGLSLAELRETGVSGGALSTALVVLKKEGRIRMEGAKVFKAQQPAPPR